MTILRKNTRPPYAGTTIPGDPGTPPQPAGCMDVVTMVPGYTTVYVTDDAGNVHGFVISTGPVAHIEHHCWEASPGTPASPAVKIPSRTADFYLGWNAAADSIGSITGAGQYRCTVNAATVGVVTGFTANPAGVTYANITHAVYCANGAYQYLEDGVAVTDAHSFTDADEFVIGRGADGHVVYSRNGVREYTSTRLSSDETIYIDAALYMGGDEITSAAIEAYTAPSGSAGGGTYDPPPPATPPDGYGPGSGPVPPPPPGTTLRYSACNGILTSFQCWASTTTPNGIQPGPGPQDGDPPDSTTGDWPGRMGGVLRMFVGHAEGQGYGNWNGGNVGEPGSGTTPTDPGGGSPVDPATGDWPGRMGGAWPMFVGQAFGGADGGDDYAILAGTLGGFTVDAGAELLTPQYAILAGELQPFQGWSTALEHHVGQLAGRLTAFTVASSTIDGGWVGDSGTPPFIPAGSVPGLGTSGTTDIFRETFTGAGGAMTGDTPDTGGAAWTGDTAELVRDGSGNLVVDAGETFGEIVSVIDPISDPVGYSTEITFTVGASGSAPSYIDFALTDAGGVNWWVDTFLHTSDGVTWMLSPSTPSDFTDVDVTALITPGDHTITTVITDTEIQFYIDGVLVPDATLPLPTLTTDIEEVHVTLQQNVGAPTVSIDELAITFTGEGVGPDIPVAGSEPDEFGDWPGRMGGVWPQFVGRAYTFDAFATGGSFDETYGGHYRLLAQGYSPSVINDPVTGFPVGYGFYGLHGGEYELDAWGGGLFSVTGPAGNVVAAGTAAIVGTFAATGPVGLLEIYGQAGLAGGLDAHHFGKWTLQAYGGGVFNVTGPHGTLGSSSGAGTAGGGAVVMAIGGFAATGPHGQLVATGYTVGLGTFDVIGPALQPVWGDLFAIGPHGQLVAAGNPWFTPGSGVAAGGSEGYSITLMETGDGLTTATSRFTQYPFERIVRFGSSYFGITPAGIYQIGGNTFDGAPIVAVVTHPPHDFSGALGRSADHAQQKVKSMRSIMLTGHVPATVQVTVAVDDDLTSANAYTYTPQPTNTARNHRIDVGRGLEGRYIALSLTNPNGEDFTLEETSAEFDVSKQRNVWRT